ncbi:MAG: PIG-L family deacetylase [Acidobacteriota bacterium]
MKISLHNPGASLFVADGTAQEQALGRVTHLGIGAHADDLEMMAYHGIARCLHDDQRWFGGITCTHGGGSARSGPYADFSDDQMRRLRREEQENAARLGRYGALLQLDYASADICSGGGLNLRSDLLALLAAMRPRVVYTHNPADKHPSHLAVLVAAIEAMRRLPREQRPRTVYGCEVWRGLDWLPDQDKVALDVSGHPELSAALLGLFDSQISSGKRYDLAALGRQRANATFHQPHQTDKAEKVALALDLTPLIQEDRMGIADYLEVFIERFRQEVKENLGRAGEFHAKTRKKESGIRSQESGRRGGE